VVLLYFIAAAAVIVPAVVGPRLAYGPGRRIGRSRVAARVAEAIGGLVTTLGRPVAAAVVLLSLSAAVITVFWPLGVLAHSLENVVDRPALIWVTSRRNPGFESVNVFYTALGDRYPLKWVTVVGALVFAALWRRRFWIPLLAVPAAFALEQYVQTIVGGMVARGHPPTGLGTYPSGGIARIVMTIGALALFASLTWRLSRRWNVALGTLVLVLATYEGYSRIYVQKHWLTDVLCGLLFGPALFLDFALAVCVLAGVYPQVQTAAPAGPLAQEPRPAGPLAQQAAPAGPQAQARALGPGQ
jgi:membrane-associated phospholipid phosphatase